MFQICGVFSVPTDIFLLKDNENRLIRVIKKLKERNRIVWLLLEVRTYKIQFNSFAGIRTRINLKGKNEYIQGAVILITFRSRWSHLRTRGV